MLTHRPNDYHPDHRYTSTLVLDSAYMVTVPHICPEVPHLGENPVLGYLWDEFSQPRRFRPDVIIVACGFDAAAFDPLGRMLCTVETFREMTRATMTLAEDICGGRLAMVHEGGYSEMYVPFCGHATLAALAGSAIDAPDPFADTLRKRQPTARFDAWALSLVDEMAAALG